MIQSIAKNNVWVGVGGTIAINRMIQRKFLTPAIYEPVTLCSYSYALITPLRLSLR